MDIDLVARAGENRREVQGAGEAMTTNTKLETERLLTLAAFLDSLKPKQFNIGTWREDEDCGTVACAVGWATTIPEFQAAGLSWDERYGTPRYRRSMDFRSSELFFGLGHSDAVALFTNTWYRSRNPRPWYRSRNPRPQTVARRIRQFVAQGR